jgi:hypothetical protein
VTFYRRNPVEFTQYLVQVAIKNTFIGAAVGIVAGLIYALACVLDFGPSYAREMLYLVGQIVAVMSSVMIVNICRPALGLWHKVQHFDEYVASVPSEIRQVDAEAAGTGNLRQEIH